MDITKLDINYIELFSLAYRVARDVFEVEPIKATPKKQKQIRRWIYKTYISDGELPDKVMSLIDEGKTDDEFIGVMLECSEYIDEKGSWKRQLFEKAAVDFSEDVKKAFVHLFEDLCFCEVVQKQGDKVIFPLEDCNAYTRKIVLHDCEDISFDGFDSFDFNDAQIYKETDGYKILFVGENCEDETEIPLVVRFKYATVEINLFRADRRDLEQTPWDRLAFISSDILDKCHLGDEYFNQKEREIMPLLKELTMLTAWAPLFERENTDFVLVKEYINKHNLPHLITALENLSRNKEGQIKPLSLSRLVNKLNDSRCEGLWRELYDIVVDSQKDYPSKSVTYDQQKLGKIRQRIEKQMSDLGYQGNYPTFTKSGSIKGIKLVESYGQSYFICAENNVSYIVQCQENFCGENLLIQFVCATAMLKKGETVKDIHSCSFDKKGRRLCRMLLWDSEQWDLVEKYAVMAAKKAECIPLDKEEKLIDGSNLMSWKYYLLMFVVMGGLFAFFMTLAALVIISLVTLIEDGAGSVFQMIKEMPWWLFFSIAFLGFGGGMTIVDIIAKRR